MSVLGGKAEDMWTPFGRSDASRVDTSVRGNVVDLAARNADILQSQSLRSHKAVRTLWRSRRS